jgi:hypothetical protein
MITNLLFDEGTRADGRDNSADGAGATGVV